MDPSRYNASDPMRIALPKNTRKIQRPMIRFPLAVCITICLCIESGPALAQQSDPVLGQGWPTGTWSTVLGGSNGAKTTWRDPRGRILSTAEQQGQRIVFRDRTGRVVGSATASSNGSTLRDASGRIVQSVGGNTNSGSVRNARGQYQGRVASNSSGLPSRDARGRVSGSTSSTRSGTTVRSSSGRVVGSTTTAPPAISSRIPPRKPPRR